MLQENFYNIIKKKKVFKNNYELGVKKLLKSKEW
jgi:hypothetical protein